MVYRRGYHKIQQQIAQQGKKSQKISLDLNLNEYCRKNTMDRGFTMKIKKLQN